MKKAGSLAQQKRSKTIELCLQALLVSSSFAFGSMGIFSIALQFKEFDVGPNSRELFV